MLLVKCLGLLLATAAVSAASIPLEDDSDVVYLSSPVLLAAQARQKRSAFPPGRAMMFHGYFGNGGHPYQSPVTPRQGYDAHNGRSYDPQGAMTAFAAGDTVSAGSSYYGGGSGVDCRNCNGAKKAANGNKKSGNGHSNGNGHHRHEVPSDIPAANDDKPVNGNGQKPVEEQDPGYQNGNGNGGGADNEVPHENGDEGYLGDEPAAEETPKGEILPPAAPTTPAAPKKGPGADDSEEDEEDEPSFFSNGKDRDQGPYYNSYFPMVFGVYPGSGRGRGGNRDDGGAHNPGVATAIANSFSTGRGAVATSHATAYGGPHFVPSGYRKNGSRGRSH